MDTIGQTIKLIPEGRGVIANIRIAKGPTNIKPGPVAAVGTGAIVGIGAGAGVNTG